MVQISIGVGRRKFASLQEAADHHGINYQTFYQRAFVNGWTVKKALTTPVRRKRKTRRRPH